MVITVENRDGIWFATTAGDHRRGYGATPWQAVASVVQIAAHYERLGLDHVPKFCEVCWEIGEQR